MIWYCFNIRSRAGINDHNSSSFVVGIVKVLNLKGRLCFDTVKESTTHIHGEGCRRESKKDTANKLHIWSWLFVCHFILRLKFQENRMRDQKPYVQYSQISAWKIGNSCFSNCLVNLWKTCWTQPHLKFCICSMNESPSKITNENDDEESSRSCVPQWTLMVYRPRTLCLLGSNHFPKAHRGSCARWWRPYQIRKNRSSQPDRSTMHHS